MPAPLRPGEARQGWRGGRGCWAPRWGLPGLPSAPSAGQAPLLGGLADLAAPGRAPLKPHKTPFSESPSSPGPDLVAHLTQAPPECAASSEGRGRASSSGAKCSQLCPASLDAASSRKPSQNPRVSPRSDGGSHSLSLCSSLGWPHPTCSVEVRKDHDMQLQGPLEHARPPGLCPPLWSGLIALFPRVRGRPGGGAWGSRVKSMGLGAGGLLGTLALPRSSCVAWAGHRASLSPFVQC